MASLQDDADRTEALIALARGKLPPEDAEALEQEIQRSEVLAAEAALWRGVADAVDAEAREAVPGELGWARLGRAIDAEGRGKVGWRPVWQMAAAAGVAVVFWQVVATPLLRPEGEGYRPVTEQGAEGFVVQVAFAPAATEGEIRQLLRDVGARVSGGPSAIGLWELAFESAAAREAGVAGLRAAGIVESVQAE